MNCDYRKEYYGIRSDVLKIIAMISMAIDHLGAIVIEKYREVIDFSTQSGVDTYIRLGYIDTVLRQIGRLAFPIFCYQLVVSFYKTSNRGKYFRNLVLFAFISEPFFDLADRDVILEFSEYQNVFFTLSIGFLAIWLMDVIDDQLENSIKDRKLSVLFQGLITVIACCLSALLKTDYNFPGVILIIVIYKLYGNRMLMALYSPVLFLIAYAVRKYIQFGYNAHIAKERVVSEMAMAISFILISQDNGVRKLGKKFKWFGYIFYPAHFLVYYLIRRFVLKV